jgi:hypothetical protein
MAIRWTRSINRYYDPTTDQFLSVDPDVATTNEPYVFTNDDPLNAEDPLGLGAFKPLTLSPQEQTAVRNKNAGIPYDKKAYNSAKEKAKENEKHGWSADGTQRVPERGHSGQDQPLPNPGTGARSVIVTGTRAAGVVGTIWFVAKVLSPACGPFVFLCAVVG